MWPFGRRGVETQLTGIETETEVELVGTMLSPNGVTSPVTGRRGAIIHLEVLERVLLDRQERRALRTGPERDDSLGEIVIGELVHLGSDDGPELSFVARRARFRFRDPRRETMPLAAIPEGLLPHLRSRTGMGALFFREHVVKEGDRLRLQAIVEPAEHAPFGSYRSVPRVAFVARDDLAPVFLEG
jgi:hypothetical protein